MNIECNIHQLQFLTGCTISVSGYTTEQRILLKGMIELCGGIYNEDMEFHSVTYLLSNNSYSEKTKHAMRWGIPVLSQQWLFDCINEQRFLSINNYLMYYKKY